jgi:transcriptional regulator with XRE-family HTH domain
METKTISPSIALGNKISTLRKQRGITLEKLAYGMGISKGNLSDIENGKRDPRFSTLNCIAKGLGMSISQLLKGL